MSMRASDTDREGQRESGIWKRINRGMEQCLANNDHVVRKSSGITCASFEEYDWTVRFGVPIESENPNNAIDNSETTIRVVERGSRKRREIPHVNESTP